MVTGYYAGFSCQNGGGFLHGGATASLVDLVASAAFSAAGLRTRGSPLEMNISYLDAAFADVSHTPASCFLSPLYLLDYKPIPSMLGCTT